jgi:hypothetical protein
MRKARSKVAENIRREYDFSGGVRGKYATRIRRGTRLVVLDPDVAAAFRTSEAVNRALRAFIATSPSRRRKSRSA